MRENYSKGKVIWWLNGEEVDIISLNKTDMKKLNVATGEADRLEILGGGIYDIIVNKINNYVKIVVKEREKE